MTVFALRPALRARSYRAASQPARPREPAADASPAAQRLLAEVLARLTGIERPIVQIVSASPHSGASRLARDFAAAAATRFGRTLVAAATGADAADPAVRGLSWLMNEFLGGQPDGITPDTLVPGLYFTSLAMQQPGPLDVPTEAWLAGPQAFRMIVIESPATAADPRGLATAARCHGSMLVVTAGVTTLPELRVAARQLANAGVLLLGTVLQDAPTIDLPLNRLRRTG